MSTRLVAKMIPVLLASLLGSTSLATASWTMGTGGQTCPDGSVPQEMTVRGCVPSDCSTTLGGGWGTTNPELLTIPKFDPSLGTLLEVEVVFNAEVFISSCTDNMSPACVPVQIDFSFAASLIPTVPINGLGQIIMLQFVPILPSGFMLGASDGVIDCPTPSGPPSNGTCAPASGDHYLTAPILTWSDPAGSFSGAAVLDWIATSPGQTIVFESAGASSFSTHSGGSGGLFQNSADGRIWLEVTYRYCPNFVGTPFCGCDSTAPCGNTGGPLEGCANSTGSGATLSASGTVSLAAANLVLHGAQLPAGKTGLFFQGNGMVGGGTGAPLGDGLRCASGSVVRLQVGTSTPNGLLDTTANLALKSGASPGDLRTYQLWYRDVAASPCGTRFNLTNGLAITWVP